MKSPLVNDQGAFLVQARCNSLLGARYCAPKWLRLLQIIVTTPGIHSLYCLFRRAMRYDNQVEDTVQAVRIC